MINKQEIPYWMALAHARGWNYEQINKLIARIDHKESSSIEKFFNLSPNNWIAHFGLTKKEIPNYSLRD